MPRVNRRDHSAGPGQEVGRLAKRALFISVLNCCCTVPVTRSVASVPCQRSGRTFLDYKLGTRPQQRGFQVRKQSCTLGNFPVNLSNFLYLLWGRAPTAAAPRASGAETRWGGHAPLWTHGVGPSEWYPKRGDTSPSSPPAEVAASQRRAAQWAQRAHAHAARLGRRIEESENPTRAHRPGMRSGEGRAPAWRLGEASVGAPGSRGGNSRPARTQQREGDIYWRAADPRPVGPC
jgi:hypothetical protein